MAVAFHGCPSPGAASHSATAARRPTRRPVRRSACTRARPPRHAAEGSGARTCRASRRALSARRRGCTVGKCTVGTWVGATVGGGRGGGERGGGGGGGGGLSARRSRMRCYSGSGSPDAGARAQARTRERERTCPSERCSHTTARLRALSYPYRRPATPPRQSRPPGPPGSRAAPHAGAHC